MLEKNLEDLSQELMEKGYRKPETGCPDIIILAPDDYSQLVAEGIVGVGVDIVTCIFNRQLLAELVVLISPSLL
jgi:hypothetical protein